MKREQRSRLNTKTPPKAPASSGDVPGVNKQPKQKHQWRLPFQKKTRAVLVVSAGALLVISLLLTHYLRERATSLNRSTKAPSFSTLLPKEKPITDLGGWQRVSPPDNDPVFAYTDSIDGIKISVSQQPLPSGMDDAQVAELAKKYNATTKLELSQPVVYIGASAKGPQSVIFTKNKLLVLIKSQGKISDEAWTNYIKSLN